MKKKVINIGIFLLSLSAGAYAQSTTLSTNPNQTSKGAGKDAKGNAGNEKATIDSKSQNAAGQTNDKAKNATSKPTVNNNTGNGTKTSAATNANGENFQGNKANGNANGTSNTNGNTKTGAKSSSTPQQGSGTQGSGSQGKGTTANANINSKANTGNSSAGSAGNAGQGAAQGSPVSKEANAKGLAAQQIARDQKGAITRTAADTAVKDGSGAGKTNMKNKTGKTGNYTNEAYKKSNPK